MSGPSETAVELAIKKCGLMIEAAGNSNHNGEVAIVRASAAWNLERALKLVLPEIKNSISCGDGRFTKDQVLEIEAALSLARGDDRVLAMAAA